MARRTKAGAAAAPAANAVQATPLALPAELTIYHVAELHPQWLAWLTELAQAQQPEHAPVQAAAVDQVDAAGLQLLLSLERTLFERGSALVLQQPSEALRRGCEALGLAGWLQAQSAHGVPA